MISFRFSVFSKQFSLLRPIATGLDSSFVFNLHPSSLVFFIVSILVIPLAGPIQAASVQPPEIVGVRVGIGERCKVGLWTPVEVTLLGGGESLSGTLSVTVPDGDGIPSRVLTPPNRPCQVLPGRQTRVLLFARIGQVVGELTVEYIVDGRVVARKLMEAWHKADEDHFIYPLEAQALVVSVGPAATGLEDIPRLKEMDNEHRLTVARVDDIGQLPTAWYGYEGVSAVVISTSQAELYRKLMPEGARLEALDRWIRMGGRLVLCVGSRADEVLAEGSGLRQFAPGRLDKIIVLKQTGALEVYAGSSAAVPQGQEGGKSGIQVAKLAGVEGIVEAREADLPLVIRTPRGLGQIVFLAADLDQGPLGKWADRPLLMAKMLDVTAARSEQQPEDAPLMHNRYNDLSGQLRSGAGRIHGRADDSFFAGGAFDHLLYSSYRAGRLLFPAQIRPADGMDLAQLSDNRRGRKRGGVCAGLLLEGRSVAGEPGRPGGC